MRSLQYIVYSARNTDACKAIAVTAPFLSLDFSQSGSSKDTRGTASRYSLVFTTECGVSHDFGHHRYSQNVPVFGTDGY